MTSRTSEQTQMLTEMNTFIRHIGRNAQNIQKKVYKYTRTKYTRKMKQKNNQSVGLLVLKVFYQQILITYLQ